MYACTGETNGQNTSLQGVAASSGPPSSLSLAAWKKGSQAALPRTEVSQAPITNATPCQQDVCTKQLPSLPAFPSVPRAFHQPCPSMSIHGSLPKALSEPHPWQAAQPWLPGCQPQEGWEKARTVHSTAWHRGVTSDHGHMTSYQPNKMH